MASNIPSQSPHSPNQTQKGTPGSFDLLPCSEEGENPATNDVQNDTTKDAEHGDDTVEGSSAHHLQGPAADYNGSNSEVLFDAAQAEKANPVPRDVAIKAGRNALKAGNAPDPARFPTDTSIVSQEPHRPTASNLPSPTAPESAPPQYPGRPSSSQPVIPPGRRRAASSPIPIPRALRDQDGLEPHPFNSLNRHRRTHRQQDLQRDPFDSVAEHPDGAGDTTYTSLESSTGTHALSISSGSVVWSHPPRPSRHVQGSSNPSRGRLPQLSDDASDLVNLSPQIMAELHQLRPGAHPESLGAYNIFALFDFLSQITRGTQTFENLLDYIMWRVRERRYDDNQGHGNLGSTSTTTNKGGSFTKPAPATTDTAAGGPAARTNTEPDAANSPCNPDDTHGGSWKVAADQTQTDDTLLATQATEAPTTTRLRLATVVVRGFDVGIPITRPGHDSDENGDGNIKEPSPVDETPVEEDAEMGV